jgi:hypothetical protein
MLWRMGRHLQSLPHSVCLLTVALAGVSGSFHSDAFAQLASHQTESVQDLVSRLTPEQKVLFDDATKAFNTQRYSDALSLYKQLLTQVPGDSILSKFAGEATLNVKDASFAMTVLKPVATTDPDDWQAAALFTRACAESGDVVCRDTGMIHMLDLHNRGIIPRGIQQYTLERVGAGENTILIRTAIELWGPYKVYDLGQVFDKDNKMLFRITLESSDSDQVQFAQAHPDEAAMGLRRFSYDGYRETGLNSDGQRTQTHYTYKMLDGQPSYTAVREEFIRIASGQDMPISSHS